MQKSYLLILALLFFAIKAFCEPTPKKFTVILDWLPNPNHAPIFIAQQQGFFKKHQLEVEIISPSDPSDPPKWIAMGRGDIALDYQLHALIAAARGLPIQQIGTLIDQPLSCLVVLANGQIKNLKDLKAKQVAYSTPEIDLLILKTMLNHEHLTLADVTPINVHYDLLQALLSKKVSAALGMMRNDELIQLEKLGQKGHAFYPEDYGVPSYSELIFIANSKKQLDVRFSDFFAALDEARCYIASEPMKSWQRFASTHKELNNELNKQIWLTTISKFSQHFESINQKQCEGVMVFLNKELHLHMNKKMCQRPVKAAVQIN